MGKSKIAKGRGAKGKVFMGKKERTSGGLFAGDLMRNKWGQVVSKKRSAVGKKKLLVQVPECSSEGSRHHWLRGGQSGTRGTGAVCKSQGHSRQPLKCVKRSGMHFTMLLPLAAAIAAAVFAVAAVQPLWEVPQERLQQLCSSC